VEAEKGPGAARALCRAARETKEDDLLRCCRLDQRLILSEGGISVVVAEEEADKATKVGWSKETELAGLNDGLGLRAACTCTVDDKGTRARLEI